MPVYSFLLLRLILLFFAFFFFFATQHITAGAVTAVFVVCYVWQLGTALKYFFPQNSRYNIFAMRLKTVTVFYLTPLSLSRVLCHFAFSMDSTVRRAKTTKITLLLNSDCVSFFSSLSLSFFNTWCDFLTVISFKIKFAITIWTQNRIEPNMQCQWKSRRVFVNAAVVVGLSLTQLQ